MSKVTASAYQYAVLSERIDGITRDLVKASTAYHVERPREQGLHITWAHRRQLWRQFRILHPGIKITEGRFHDLFHTVHGFYTPEATRIMMGAKAPQAPRAQQAAKPVGTYTDFLKASGIKTGTTA